MKQALFLVPVQREMIKTAMRSHRLSLVGSGQMLFDISYNKIKNMNVKVELDGMELIYIAQSLNSYAKKLITAKKFVEANKYRGMGLEIEQIRIQFQLQYGPKVKKEKAASAGTLTA